MRKFTQTFLAFLLILSSEFGLSQEVWYRDISIDEWVANGANKKDINSALKVIYDKNILNSGNSLVDDVELSYKSGNWLYEWMNFASKQQGDKLAISQYFAIGMTGYNSVDIDREELKKAYNKSVELYDEAMQTSSTIEVVKENVKNRTDSFTYFIHKSKKNKEKPKVAIIYITDISSIATQNYYFVSEFLKLHSSTSIITADLFENNKGEFIKKDAFFFRLDRLIKEVVDNTGAKKIFLMGRGLVSNQLITAYKNNKELLGSFDKIKGVASVCGFNHYQLTKTGFKELTRQERRGLNNYFLSQRNSEYNDKLLYNSVFDNKNINKGKKANILNLYNVDYELYSTDAKILENEITGLVNRPFTDGGCMNISVINEMVNWVRQNG